MGGEFDKLRALMQATKQNIFEMHNMISEWSKTSNIKDELTGQIVNELSHRIADLAGAWYDMNAHIESIEPVELKAPAEPEDEGPDEASKKMAADIQTELNKAATDEKINMASGAEPTPTPRPLSNDDEWADDYDKKHEGFEKQAEGLDNLLEGLRDTPHDNRW